MEALSLVISTMDSPCPMAQNHLSVQRHGEWMPLDLHTATLMCMCSPHSDTIKDKNICFKNQHRASYPLVYEKVKIEKILSIKKQIVEYNVRFPRSVMKKKISRELSTCVPIAVAGDMKVRSTHSMTPPRPVSQGLRKIK